MGGVAIKFDPVSKQEIYDVLDSIWDDIEDSYSNHQAITYETFSAFEDLLVKLEHDPDVKTD